MGFKPIPFKKILFFAFYDQPTEKFFDHFGKQFKQPLPEFLRER